MKNPSEKGLVRVSKQLRDYLERTAASNMSTEDLMQAIFTHIQQLRVPDLWEPRDLAATYWILLISGVNQTEELDIANAVIFWKTFLAKQSAQVLCIQSSDREDFRCCSANFGVAHCPTLIFSDTPDMEEFVKIDPQLLFSLAAQKGGLQRFLTRIHSLVENGKSISEVQTALDSEKFWSGLKLVYGEVKSLVSFKKDL